MSDDKKLINGYVYIFYHQDKPNVVFYPHLLGLITTVGRKFKELGITPLSPAFPDTIYRVPMVLISEENWSVKTQTFIQINEDGGMVIKQDETLDTKCFINMVFANIEPEDTE